MSNGTTNSGAEYRSSPPIVRRIKLRNSRTRDVLVSIIEGRAIFEGDIVFSRPLETLGIGITGPGVLWPNGQIPYVIDQDFDNPDRVNRAIAHWHDHTAIRFIERMAAHNDFVRFSNGNSCESAVGRIGGVQIVTLGPSCETGNAIHEMGHVVGLWHEQSRADRDKFITIKRDNIDEDALHNFDQHITDGEDIDTYDYGSIMHYAANAFATDPSKPTIVTPHGEIIGQRDGLSPGDVETVRELYAKA